MGKHHRSCFICLGCLDDGGDTLNLVHYELQEKLLGDEKMTKYLNTWHRPNSNYGPRIYETEAKPVEYAGCLIYERIKGHCWDIVKNGVCVHQRAGLRGAKE